jgi:Leucine-rich repeat (LRR) protein
METSSKFLMVDDIVNASLVNKNKILKLQNLNLTEMPDLHTHTWIEDLNLGNNGISMIKKEYLPPNLKRLDIYKNKIRNLTVYDIVDSIKSLSISYNPIISFDGTRFTNLTRLDIFGTNLQFFQYPPNLTHLDISSNNLINLQDCPESLYKLDCSSNHLTYLPIINSNNTKFTKINFSDNQILEFPKLPDTVKIIQGKKNRISEIKSLPKNLENLDMSDNRINSLSCVLPASLTILNLSDNFIMHMPDLPTNIEEVDLSGNQLIALKIIPESCKKFDCSNNSLTEIPEELLKRDMFLKYTQNAIQSNDSDESNNAIESLFESDDTRFRPFQGTGNVLGNNTSSFNQNNYYNYNRGTFTFGSSPTGRSSMYYPHLNNQPSWGTTYTNPYTNSKAHKNNPHYISIKNKKDVIV